MRLNAFLALMMKLLITSLSTVSLLEQVWFWMGDCQMLFTQRDNFQDILQFALTLHSIVRNAFLTVVSTVCWCLWKTRNEVTFHSSSVKSVRNMILLICSLVQHWSGLTKLEEKKRMKRWMPMSFEMIPPQKVPPVLALA